MANTTAEDVFDSFETMFTSKVVLPEALETLWLKKAIGRYSVELSPLNFDADTNEFDSDIGQYAVDTLAAFMKQSYQEREVSRVNQQVSIVGKDISIDGAGHTKNAAKSHLEHCKDESELMIANQKDTAYYD